MTYATDSLTAPATEPTFLISYLLTSDGHEGGGFRLKLFDGGQEEGGGVFPVEAYQDEMISDPEARHQAALVCAWNDAHETGTTWLNSR